jgi:hypothetical protein
MYHSLEFRLKGLAALETPGKAPLQQVVIKPGTRLRAHVKPHVVESALGPVEVADLFLEDGSVARGVRFASFSFVEE